MQGGYGNLLQKSSGCRRMRSTEVPDKEAVELGVPVDEIEAVEVLIKKLCHQVQLQSWRTIKDIFIKVNDFSLDTCILMTSHDSLS